MSRMNYLFLWLSDGANVGTMQQAAAIVSPLINRVTVSDPRSPSVSVGGKLPVPCKLPDTLYVIGADSQCYR
jgi:hypothetical protein